MLVGEIQRDIDMMIKQRERLLPLYLYKKGVTLNEVESRLIQGAELSEGEKELLDIFETIYTIEDFIILKPELIQ